MMRTLRPLRVEGQVWPSVVAQCKLNRHHPEELRNKLTRLQHKWLDHPESCEHRGSALKSYARRYGLSHRRFCVGNV